jgi:ketosteroid isomerase-like protein
VGDVGENVEIVRRAIETWNRQDLTAALAPWSSDGEMDWSRANGPFKGVYRGHHELEAFWNEFWATFEVVEVELSDFRQRGPYVVVSNTAHMRGREGVEVAARSTFVSTIENGLIIRLQMFQERAEALEAAGLSLRPGLGSARAAGPTLAPAATTALAGSRRRWRGAWRSCGAASRRLTGETFGG